MFSSFNSFILPFLPICFFLHFLLFFYTKCYSPSSLPAKFSFFSLSSNYSFSHLYPLLPFPFSLSFTSLSLSNCSLLSLRLLYVLSLSFLPLLSSIHNPTRPFFQVFSSTVFFILPILLPPSFQTLNPIHLSFTPPSLPHPASFFVLYLFFSRLLPLLDFLGLSINKILLSITYFCTLTLILLLLFFFLTLFVFFVYPISFFFSATFSFNLTFLSFPLLLLYHFFSSLFNLPSPSLPFLSLLISAAFTFTLTFLTFLFLLILYYFFSSSLVLPFLAYRALSVLKLPPLATSSCTLTFPPFLPFPLPLLRPACHG